MSFIAPLAEAATAEGAAVAGTRSGAFAQGLRGVLPGGLRGMDGDKPIVEPQKAPIDDVSGMARSTVNPNTTLR
jgi:hypothetical protein